MFTDIEGSTRLLEELGMSRYRTVQDVQAAIVRQAIAEGEGVEVRTEGDSFFVAFRSPVGAVKAAVAAQRGLAAHRWSDAPVRVRIGLHTGEGVVGGDDYVGMDVNRAARISAAGHGGQVLLSEATRGLVEHSLPEHVQLRALGAHRLKDISHPEHLFDLVIADLSADFPPLSTLDLRPNNLPLQLTSFVGREREIEEVRSLLLGTRLLTMTGPGGAGKTRLALQVAAEVLADFGDGAFFADLSAIADPALVPSAFTVALGVTDTTGRTPLDLLHDHLREKELLLIADNFEQVVVAAPVVERLLAIAPRLKVLVTSRVALSLRGEQEYVIPPLELPTSERFSDLPRLCRLEAVRLFTERAKAALPGFEVTEKNGAAVAQITAKLDGLPLAIELAATRTKLLSPEQVLARLGEGLGILSSKVQTLPERQRTLRGAIAWSYDLLNHAEQRLFARLSVFAGGWTFESGESVCDPTELGLDPLEGLSSLVDNSLVTRTETPDGESRFSMLGTIREFAAEQLRALEEDDVMLQRHARHYLELAREFEPHLTGARQRMWLDRCGHEHANFRSALRWAIDTGDAEGAQLAAGALWRFWQQRGHLAEGRKWFEEILAMPSGQAASTQRSKALAGAGGIAWWQSDQDAVGAFYGEALAIERDLGDPGGIAEALFNYAHVAFVGGDIESAGRLFEESLDLFRRVGDEAGVARVLSMLAGEKAWRGDWDSSLLKIEEVVAIWRRLGNRFQLADNLATLATAYSRVGRWTEAWSAAHETFEIAVEDDVHVGVAMSLLTLAFLASWEGRDEEAVCLAGASDVLREQLGGGAPTDFLAFLIGDPVGEARSRLPADVAERAWEDGRRMSMNEAVAYARSRTRATGD
jgi:predicted ATPase/class 3 adenylate cyclase